MIKTFLRFYNTELATWIYFTPIVLTAFSLLLFIAGLGEYTSYFILGTSITVVCALYFDLREQQLLMTRILPASLKSFRQLDVLFTFRIALFYLLYALMIPTIFISLFQGKLVLPHISNVLLCISLCLIIIGIYTSFRRTKHGHYLNFLIILMPFILTQLFDMFDQLTAALSSTLAVFVGSIAFYVLAYLVHQYLDERRDFA